MLHQLRPRFGRNEGARSSPRVSWPLLARANPQACRNVGVSLEAQLGLDASTLHHASKAACREWRVPLGREHERRLRFLLTLQLAQGPHLVATDGMGTRRALLGPPYVQDGVGEIDLIPTQVCKLGRPRPWRKATRIMVIP